MASNQQPRKAERVQTNSSLTAERLRTDTALAQERGRVEKRASAVVERAREHADETLGTARAKSDAKLEDAGASLEAFAEVKAEQAEEDTTLDGERRTADILLESERRQRLRALESLLQLERKETDKNLVLERALIDERLARIFAELAEAVRLRDDFIALASHELKTPLTPIALRLQSLARELATQPDSPFAHHVNAYVETAKKQISRFSALVADLLDVSRITSGKMTLDLESVDFGAALQAVAARYAPLAHSAGSVLEVEAPSVLGHWDELLLEEAVACLFENAIKFGQGRPIRARLTANTETARLTVEDEGIGIAPEHLARIFGRFERAVSDRNYGGLGLGLYTCRTIVEAMGGTVKVHSEPDRGATFSVDLPLSGP